MSSQRIMNNYIFVGLINLSFYICGLQSLDNGVAKVPPMGWTTWDVFGLRRCNPSITSDNCLSEGTIKKVADKLVAKEYLDLGYKYILIEGDWQPKDKPRDSNNRLQSDATLFPSGMKALAKYVHDKKLELGIFSDLGEMTRAGTVGCYGHLKEDADTFAEWGIDYIKMDAYVAYNGALFSENDYVDFGECIKKTKRPMVYETYWPMFEEDADYEKIATHSNTWRFAGSTFQGWNSLIEIMDSYAKNEAAHAVVRPGSWPNAGQLIAGASSVQTTVDQAKAQMAVWSIIPSALFFSANIDHISPEMEAVVKNREVININQDHLGLPGYRFKNDGSVDIWVRAVSPVTSDGYHSYAIAFVNRNAYEETDYEIKLEDIGLNNPNGYFVLDLFSTSETTLREENIGRISSKDSVLPSDSFKMSINPSGVVMYKAKVISSCDETINNMK